ncbi:dienelactone hydrolase family protein [Leucothrix pacifica]|uniref:Dienelactone hydrolase n=1 Tax=Leucothrix pacifica TaxID=1247513 RepID=A0A317CHY6_9GAMM|nr:dienelactone hydrolase family protein [Leucothrix pacifica]PWQ97023.1 dienelactone hydrolase [Leucothrix pacifica]
MCNLDGCGNQQDLPEIKIDPEQRRLFMKGMATLPLASVLAFPELASAAAGGLQDVTIKTASGNSVTASVAMPKTDEKAPTIILIHEWWGLNDQIKAVAAEFAKLGYIAVAVDMYGGEVATDAPGAMSLMKTVTPESGTEILSAWVDWLKNHDDSNGKVATLGWCFGGGWSLNASLATSVDATVIYYGRVNKTPEQLATLNSPVLGHFGTLDKSINKEMVNGFLESAKTAGKDEQILTYWYNADHAFANPTGSRYDADDASLAWERTLKFLSAHLS